MKTESGRKNPKTYGLCVKNRGYAASLEARRVYQVIADSKAEARGLIRVIDESGDDHVHPQSFFVRIDVPKKATRLFVHSA